MRNFDCSRVATVPGQTGGIAGGSVVVRGVPVGDRAECGRLQQAHGGTFAGSEDSPRNVRILTNDGESDQ